MELTPQVMYSLRETNLLPIPADIQAAIAKIALIAAAPPPFRKAAAAGGGGGARRKDDWRARVLVDYHSKLKGTDDAEFTALRMTLNKLVKSNVEMVTSEFLKSTAARTTEPDLFRLRIVNLLFNQGMTMSTYSALVADVTKSFIAAYPEAQEDLAANFNTDALNSMFNMNETTTFPSSELPDFEDLVCKWNQQRGRRRGFIIFVSDLFARGLVGMDVMKSAVEMVLPDLETNMRSPMDTRIAENVDQTVTILFEMMRVVGKTEMGTEIKNRLRPILAAPRTELTCLGMRSRFKIEDILKL